METEQKDQLPVGSRVTHRAYGRGVVVDRSLSGYTIYFEDLDKAKHLPHDEEGLEVVDAGDVEHVRLTMEEVEDALWRVVSRHAGLSEEVKLGDRWIGGSISITPGSPELQSKELPIDALFHKIVMVRDRLRVLEQQINIHPKLDDEDRVHLQQYITRVYGSLTSFNLLFKHKGDHFSGSGKA